MSLDRESKERQYGLACVFGVSGVGKTSMIREFLRQRTDWASIAASQILAECIDSDHESLRQKSKEAILQNQKIISDSVKRRRHALQAKHLVLDAHSVVDNDNEFVSIPVEAITPLEPVSLVFVFDEPEEIFKRRQCDSSRTRAKRTVAEISEEQALAFQNVESYSTALGIPLRVVRSGDVDALASALHASKH